jgi:hypothetical protein
VKVLNVARQGKGGTIGKGQDLKSSLSPQDRRRW